MQVTGSKRPRFVAVIVGISGNERYLMDEEGHETHMLRRAKRFGSDKRAGNAATARIALEKPVVAKHMSFRVEPIQRVQL